LNKDALKKMAKLDGSALYMLAKELGSELHPGGGEEIDPDMVLPLCKEIQAKAQAIASRIGACVELEEGEGEA